VAEAAANLGFAGGQRGGRCSHKAAVLQPQSGGNRSLRLQGRPLWPPQLRFAAALRHTVAGGGRCGGHPKCGGMFLVAKGH